MGRVRHAGVDLSTPDQGTTGEIEQVAIWPPSITLAIVTNVLVCISPRFGLSTSSSPIWRVLTLCCAATTAFERLNCRMPSAEEASLLNISRSQPVIDMDRWVWADD